MTSKHRICLIALTYLQDWKHCLRDILHVSTPHLALEGSHCDWWYEFVHLHDLVLRVLQYLWFHIRSNDVLQRDPQYLLQLLPPYKCSISRFVLAHPEVHYFVQFSFQTDFEKTRLSRRALISEVVAEVLEVMRPFFVFQCFSTSLSLYPTTLVLQSYDLWIF